MSVESDKLFSDAMNSPLFDRDEKKKNALGLMQPITTTTAKLKRKKKKIDHAKYGVQLMPDRYSAAERMRRTFNSAAFDRAAYAADGGDSWVDARREVFFKTAPLHADKVLWKKAEDASVQAFGGVKWQFVLWAYKKLGGVL